jgi:Sec-independent protein translocase protein TatA
VVAFIGPLEAGLLVLVILFLFGGARFVGVARGLGRGAREFKGAIKGEDKRPELPEDGRGEAA